MKSTRFSFTCLRPTQQTDILLAKLNDLFKEIFYSVETGPVSGISHYQGYLETKEPMELFALKAKLPKFYLEIARESAQVNEIYCSKQNPIKRPFDEIFDSHDLCDDCKDDLNYRPYID